MPFNKQNVTAILATCILNLCSLPITLAIAYTHTFATLPSPAQTSEA